MRWVSVVMLLLCAGSVSAWEFTEVMANPDGSDSGREWVELFGDALPPDARFVEDGGSHFVRLVQGSCVVDCVIIIADDAYWFLGEYDVGVGVLVYDSSWSSLRNDGEELQVTIGGVPVAMLSYASAPSGLSLQGGVWSLPTPGVIPSVGEVPEFGIVGLAVLLSVAFMVLWMRRG